MTVQSYKQLIAWQKAVALVTDVYTATAVFPKGEIYGLTTQIRRAAVSVASNIAEGQGRGSTGEFKQFLCVARGSLFELETQFIIAVNLKYIAAKQGDGIGRQIMEVARIMNGLLKALE